MAGPLGRHGAPTHPALAAQEVGAVNENQSPSSELAEVLGILKNACTEMHGVQTKLDKVAGLPEKLDNLKEWLTKLEDKIDKSAAAHAALQSQYLSQSHKHELEIQAIQLTLKNYNTIVKLVYDTQKTLQINSAVTGVLVVALLAIVANGPAWWNLFKSNPKTTSLLPMTIPREQG